MGASTEYSPYGVNLGLRISPFGFAGEWTDPDTNHSYLRARWLDTTTGTFLSRDPKVQTTGDAYGYAAGNPLSLVDPLGLDAFGGDVFSWMDSNWFKNINNFSAGLGDGLTLGGTKAIRQSLGADNVQECSWFYKGGEITAAVAMYFLPGGFETQLLKAGKESLTMGKTIANTAKSSNPGSSYLPSTFKKLLDPQKDGIVYYRVDLNGKLAPYVGKSKSPAAFDRRMKAHQKKHPNSRFKFEIIGNEDDIGHQLSRMEEFFMRKLGGPISNGGTLSNKIPSLNNKKYTAAGGDYY